MSFDQPDNPFFLSFTDVLTCVLGGSISLFLIFVTLVKLVPAEQSSQASAGVDQRAGILRALEREKTAGASAATLQLVSESCETINSIAVENAEIWSLTSVGPKGETLCGRLIVFAAGLPSSTTPIKSDFMPSRPIWITLTVGASVWSRPVVIDADAFRQMGALLTIVPSAQVLNTATSEVLRPLADEPAQ
ncbi:hypothetical protein [uncultured Devosia sp.]|uniref:hypothetical protein n=1 Tax=uncultured Devosia sp. TaxID=211434 RepID=UPI0026102390|nr:hypothetical protein [uncultured Devosia sp.]